MKATPRAAHAWGSRSIVSGGTASLTQQNRGEPAPPADPVVKPALPESFAIAVCPQRAVRHFLHTPPRVNDQATFWARPILPCAYATRLAQEAHGAGASFP